MQALMNQMGVMDDQDLIAITECILSVRPDGPGERQDSANHDD